MLLKCFISFLKIGCIGFGGGSALIPVVEEEIVNRRRFLDRDRYTEHTIVSNITPGALPVKLGALSGYDICGIPGMLIGSAAVAIPGAAATVLLLAMLSVMGAGAVRQIEFASVGISMFIIYLLLEYIIKVLRDCGKNGFQRQALFLMLFSAAVTGGGELHRLVQLILSGILPEAGAGGLSQFGFSFYSLGQPVLDISTIDLLILSFFVIFFTGGRHIPWRTAVSALMTALYLLLFGKGCPFDGRIYGLALQIIMSLLASGFVLHDSKREASRNVNPPDWNQLLRKLAAFALTAGLCWLPAFLLISHSGQFLTDGIVSTITSFGGGEAYLTVASSMFVDSGQVTSSQFYGQILPIANALPGPILVKILSGVGYQIGLGYGAAAGFALALTGFGAAIASTCMVCVVVQTVYQCFAGLRVFYILKLWILPVICGMLISVILSMLGESLRIAETEGVGSGAALLLSGVFLLLIRSLCHRLGLNDLAVIVIAGVLSITAFQLI